MRSRISLLILLGILQDSICYCQYSTIDSLPKPVLTDNVLVQHFIYIDPSAMVNPNFGIQVGYERNVYKRLNILVEGSYLAPAFTDMSGFKIMVSPRVYNGRHFFLGYEGVLKRISANRNSFFDVGTHFQRLDYKSIIRNMGMALQLGWNFPTEDERTFFELAFSFGLLSREVIHKNTNGFTLLESPPFGLGWNVGIPNIPYFNISTKLKFSLNKP